jgi:hypothetical protein
MNPKPYPAIKASFPYETYILRDGRFICLLQIPNNITMAHEMTCINS